MVDCSSITHLFALGHVLAACFGQLRHNSCGTQEILLGHPRSRLGISPKITDRIWPFKIWAGSHLHTFYTSMDETGWQWGWWLSSRVGVRTNAWSCCPQRRWARQEASQGVHSNHSQPSRTLGKTNLPNQAPNWIITLAICSFHALKCSLV